MSRCPNGVRTVSAERPPVVRNGAEKQQDSRISEKLIHGVFASTCSGVLNAPVRRKLSGEATCDCCGEIIVKPKAGQKCHTDRTWCIAERLRRKSAGQAARRKAKRAIVRRSTVIRMASIQCPLLLAYKYAKTKSAALWDRHREDAQQEIFVACLEFGLADPKAPADIDLNAFRAKIKRSLYALAKALGWMPNGDGCAGLSDAKVVELTDLTGPPSGKWLRLWRAA